jgi:hypothetical protein
MAGAQQGNGRGLRRDRSRDLPVLFLHCNSRSRCEGGWGGWRRRRRRESREPARQVDLNACCPRMRTRSQSHIGGGGVGPALRGVSPDLLLRVVRGCAQPKTHALCHQKNKLHKRRSEGGEKACASGAMTRAQCAAPPTASTRARLTCCAFVGVVEGKHVLGLCLSNFAVSMLRQHCKKGALATTTHNKTTSGECGRTNKELHRL